MSSRQKCDKKQVADAQSLPSKDMDRLPENFGPVFFQNQFRTKIELPAREKYPGVEGKCAIVTGSNTGLGFESAKQLLSLGLSHLVLGVRSLEKGEQAASKLRLVNTSAKVDVYQLDMESYESIQAFARKCQEDLSHIDIVILNAGLSPLQFAIIPGTGHEKTIQVNHISTVLLTLLFLPVLKNKSKGPEPPRITIVNSVMAHLCKVSNKSQRPFLPSFDDTSIIPWNPEERYGVSKLLLQLFIVKLADHVSPNDVIINMVDPGLTKGTELARGVKGATAIAAKMFFSIAGRPVERGAATYIDAALGHGKESHGCFLMNCRIAPLARWYYTDGEVLTDLIWTETLQELSFADVQQIIKSTH
ncbi:hypothetical protein BGZ61DRAFT_571845 [Ilyonectria robusta]|uniref:uncharacterized protein n=1 Tax=Ilyonectria robusta TaxID=1079257 RepID=UPI001E8E6664|nr:uncharacterized protein BGZ61DRAFT_571845 [Ilyonectria robusta]KAH8721745.1 hypothetical protein BGZ61DRAFT_571845 [Ilyonectria robusta]